MPHREVMLKQIMLHCHTISYHCTSIIADCSNTGQQKNHISYLLSSLQRQHHHSTSLTTTDPSLLGKSFRRSFGSAAGSSAAAEASAAGADAQPAYPPAAASGPSCKGQGCRGKTEIVTIGMNALIDLEYAAGTLSVESRQGRERVER